jgi:tetratricopeptide (TPR) repeat protein
LPASEQQLLSAAINCHNAGQLRQADALYAEVVRVNRRNDQALHRWALLKRDQGKPREALSLLDRAIQIDAKAVLAHCHRAYLLQDLGRWQEAISSLERAIALKPDFAESHLALGIVRADLGQVDEACASFDRAAELDPQAADVQLNKAILLEKLGRLKEALEALEAALLIAPGEPNILVRKAACLRQQGELTASVQVCERVLASTPDLASASFELGFGLVESGRHAEALAAFQAAVRHNFAVDVCLYNIGNCHRELRQLEEALLAYRRVIGRSPDHAQAINNLAITLKELGRFDEAEESCRTVLRLRPDDPMFHFNLGILLLLVERFQEGWDEYEWRSKAGILRVLDDAPRWCGEPLAGRTLLIRAEQGLGDTLQFCRYVSLVAEQGSAVLEVQRGLRHLLRDIAPCVVELGDSLPPFDVWCPLLSLPRIVGMQAPGPPYLAADGDLVAAWRDRIGGHGRRIGIAWQGNPTSPAERGRSIPVREFLPLAQVPDVRLISLQKHHGLEQLATLPEGLRIETLGEGFDAGPNAFSDTAAVMQCLDLIITSDTSVAHLAGALGRPVWVALQRVPDWRWMLGRSDNPWYPSMRVFRQETRGDWSIVFANIALALAERGKPPVPTV